MSWTAAVVLIVLIVAVSQVMRARYNAQHGITEDMMGNQTLSRPTDREGEQERDREAEAEIAALKDRIAVLERIAYDKNSSTARERDRIAAEIDALREEQD
ncbi:hypothetical protein [Alteriqipengyuania sp.]|uniref:hypothetical protein n=1 Tax=Alteriqipengyuania sp. TaxID=2800692 RepID=UPI003517E2F9